MGGAVKIITWWGHLLKMQISVLFVKIGRSSERLHRLLRFSYFCIVQDTIIQAIGFERLVTGRTASYNSLAIKITLPINDAANYLLNKYFCQGNFLSLAAASR